MCKVYSSGVLAVMCLQVMVMPVKATDYYVSPNGSGDGSSAARPASIASAIGKVGGYSVTTEPLNVIFADGVYTPSGSFTVRTSGVTVNLRAAQGASVTLAGNSGQCLIDMSGIDGTADRPLTVNLANVTVDGLNVGANPLFRVNRAYNVLTLDGVTVKGVKGATSEMFSITNSLAGLTVSNSTIADCASRGWFVNSATTATFTNTRFSGNSSDKSFFYIDNRNSRLVLVGDTLTDNRAVGSNLDNESFIWQVRGDCFVHSCLFYQNTVAVATSGRYNALFANSNNGGDTFNPMFVNSTFSRNEIGSASASNSRFLFFFQSEDGIRDSTTFRNCSIAGNRVATSTPVPDRGLHLISVFNVSWNNPFVMTGTTVADNVLEGATGLTNNRYVVNIRDVVWDYIINNTFANNLNALQAIGIANPGDNYAGSGGVFIVNNTFYKTGNILSSANPNIHIVNNVLADDGSAPRSNVIDGGGTSTEVARNVIDNRFYKLGTSGGEALPDNNPTGYYLDFTALRYDGASASGDRPRKPGYFAVAHAADAPHGILGMGGALSSAGNDWCRSVLTYDQRGNARPPAAISLGSIDSWKRLHTGQRIIYYDPDRGLLPFYEFDLKDYLVPAPWDESEQVSYRFEVVKQPDVIGKASIVADGEGNEVIARFKPLTDPANPDMPAIGTVGRPTLMRVSLTTSDGGEEATDIRIIIVNVNAVGGIIDNTYSTCYDVLGKASFNASVGYRSDQIAGQENLRFDGFSIPLVGDLTGDGKPEIVLSGLANSTECGTGDHNETMSYIYILNGQTGEKIGELALPSPFHLHCSTCADARSYHGPPSWMVLADPTGEGPNKSIYLAYGNASAAYEHRVVRYDVVEAAAGRLDIREVAVSDVRYNSPLPANTTIDNSKGTRPIPQVCDIDADGHPELLVYNKIYDAATLKMKVELEKLDDATWDKTAISDYGLFAYCGRNRAGNTHGDGQFPFSFIYDLDADGRMEVVAGGKVYYDINTSTGSYSVKSADDSRWNLGIGDGYTGVADIDGDGIADIVVVSLINNGRLNRAPYDNLRVVVWNPGLRVRKSDGTYTGVVDKANTAPSLMADIRVPMSYKNAGGTWDPYGTHSYVYIGDIDGLLDSRGLRLPEISVLSARMYSKASGSAGAPIHPNVRSRMSSGTWGGKWNASTGLYSDITYRDPEYGVLTSWTWDTNANPQDVTATLKVSFMMGHEDSSFDTGFTMFDFDNDGSQEIVYRDEHYLRVISPTKPLIASNDNDGNRFSTVNKSYTGLEYPVIADVNGDASADILVISACYTGGGEYLGGKGVLYMIESAAGSDRFAPALSVWNQFHYSPLKINEQLIVPRKNMHPLSPAYDFTIPAGGKSYIFNNTITQGMRLSMVNGVLQAVVMLPDLVVSDVVLDDAVSPPEIRYTVTNRGDAAANDNTPIKYYMGANDGYVVPANIIGSSTLGVTLYPDDETNIIFPISTDKLGNNFTISVADIATVNGTACFQKGCWPECTWSDNRAETGNIKLYSDIYTVVQNSSNRFSILANDKIPGTMRPTTLADSMFHWSDIGAVQTASNQWTGDFGLFSLDSLDLLYTAPTTFTPGVVALPYTISTSGHARSDTIYIFVVHDARNRFLAPSGIPYTYRLKDYPAPLPPNTHGVDFIFYDTETTNEIHSTGPDTWPTIANPQATPTIWVKPQLLSPARKGYERIDFPRAKITLRLMGRGRVFLSL